MNFVIACLVPIHMLLRNNIVHISSFLTYIIKYFSILYKNHIRKILVNFGVLFAEVEFTAVLCILFFIKIALNHHATDEEK